MSLLLGRDPVARARGLSASIGVAGLLAFGLHRLDPGLPFPLQAAPWTAGSVVALLIAAPVPRAVRRFGVLLAAGLLLYGGLPAAHRATFPWIELGRARLPEWEDLALFSLFVLAPVGLGPLRGWFERGRVLLGVLGLAVALLAPVKASFQVLSPPRAGMVAVPVLGWSEPVPMRWTRVNAEGSALVYLPALVRDEWALMNIAGGIHQDAAEPGVFSSVRQAARYAIWRALQGVVAAAWGLRVAAVPAGLVALAASLLPAKIAVKFPRPLSLATRISVRGAIWAVPAANLVALALSTLTVLPDDLALRLPALGSCLGMCAVCALIEASLAAPAVVAAREAA